MASIVNELYIVPKEVYEHCNKPRESVQEKLDKLSKKAKSNAIRIWEYLKTLPEYDNESGRMQGYLENIFNYLNYSVRGKQRPVDWESFVSHLITLPPTLFCEKVKREVKIAKRRHGRQLHTSRVDQLLTAGSS